MTKLSNIPTKGVTAKATRTRKAKTESTKLVWDPTKPIQFTQEEIWEHIHEIEKGPFMTLDECFNRFDKWKQEFLKSRL
ncbi:hypothetical protein [Parabacteroides distasonis]|jgi:hypothetical protein|uniref:hypothetical protein n=1 Tax=Parabacteroides distasonis TaxID=823 RepID=UPI00189B218D|nr:hypothetical protein [Parabacteroides distasonis]